MTHPPNIATVAQLSPAERRDALERENTVALRAYKRLRGLSCLELATELAVSVDSVERYLTGRRPVPGHVVLLLTLEGRRAA